MKSGSIGKDIIQIIGIGLVLTVILTIISIGASLAIGIPGSTDANGTPAAVNLAAMIPTSPPPTATPTEIPCTIQEWWDKNSAPMGEVFTNARNTTITTRVPDVQKAQAALKVWQTNFEVSDVAPPCAKPAKDAALVAAKTADDLYNFYTTPTTDAQRAQQSIQLADKLLLLYDALENLKVTATDAWLVEVRDYTRSDCPAARWYTENFIGKGYSDFIKTNPKLDITKLTPAQMTDLLKQFRTLQSSLNTDKAAFPECVNQAADYLITYFKAGADALNSALNNDLASVQGSLTLMPTALNSFYATVKTLDPTLGK
ncbi:MAG: hypothetical protein GC179_15705 [Anaerolineaceae bacterium]|nr:hypothetical protein [Anaerolineaceae bacterium]